MTHVYLGGVGQWGIVTKAILSMKLPPLKVLRPHPLTRNKFDDDGNLLTGTVREPTLHQVHKINNKTTNEIYN